jgi:hypothetical protein
MATPLVCASDGEILTDFARMLAFKTMLDDLHATPTGDVPPTPTAWVG